MKFWREFWPARFAEFANDPKEIAAFVAEVRAKGDAKRGAEIYQRPTLGCVACHAINGQGGNIGPNLSALGSAQPIDFIVGAILEPQKEIKEGYTSISVTTKDGEEYQGYQLRETKEELVLRDTLQNKEVRLARAMIQEKRQNGSVMPAGWRMRLRAKNFAIWCDTFRSWDRRSKSLRTAALELVLVGLSDPRIGSYRHVASVIPRVLRSASGTLAIRFVWALSIG